MIGTIQTMEIGTISDSIKTKTSTTSFAGISGINKNNSISIQYSLIPYKLPKLVITPIVQPISLFFINSTFSNAFNIFHNNSISYINRGNYCLADFMIALSHEAFLFSRNLSKEFSGTSCAFRLQSRPQVSEFGFDIFNLVGIEELIIGRNCNIINTDVNSNKVTRNIINSNISGKSNMQKHPVKSFIINNSHSLIAPIKIFPVVFWNLYGNIYSLFGYSYSYLIKRKRKSPLIKVQRHKLFINWPTSLIGFNRVQSLRSYSNSINNILRRKIKLISSFVVSNMMKFVSVTYIMLKAHIRNIGNSFRILFHSIDNLLVARNLKLYSSSCFHTLNKMFLFKCPTRGCHVTLAQNIYFRVYYLGGVHSSQD